MQERMREKGNVVLFEVNPRGAGLARLSFGGQDWLGQWPSSTDGGMTSGFAMLPVIGQISRSGQFMHEGETYTPGKHGYARATAFDVTGGGADVCLRHRHDPDRAPGRYPFAHQVDVDYAAAGNILTTRVTVKNLADEAMPFGCGLHPAFKWPLPGATGAHALRLMRDLPEGTVIYRPRADGIIAANSVEDSPFDRNRAWHVVPDDFTRDAYFFVLPEARRGESVALSFEAGTREVRIDMVGWDGFGIWSKPEGGPLCIEPLAGVAVAEAGSPDTPELTEIKGLRRLPPHEKFMAKMVCSFM